MKTKILVIGGAGYIGSHMVRALLRAGFEPIVFDNLSTGDKHSLPPEVTFVEGDILNRENLKSVFREFQIGAVMHFAAFSIVSESVERPLQYYRNNVAGFVTLLYEMIEARVCKIIFSSTAAVYGAPSEIPIKEDSPVQPTNPYGWSKLMIERILQDVSRIHSLSYVILRYFNAAGADDSAEIGENHQPETHLIPNVLGSLQDPNRKLTIFGDDYNTADGTCVRDYIHVQDLCQAHLLALRYLEKGGKNDVFNLGSQKGYSIKQVIQTAEDVTQRKIFFELGPVRPGDPPELIAEAEKAKKILGWEPKRDLSEMIHSAYKYQTQKQSESPCEEHV